MGSLEMSKSRTGMGSRNKEADLLGLNESKLSAIEKPEDTSIQGNLLGKMRNAFDAAFEE